MSVMIMYNGVLATDSRGLAPNGFYDGVQKLFISEDSTIAFATVGQSLSPEEAPYMFKLLAGLITQFETGVECELSFTDTRCLFALHGTRPRSFFIITKETCYKLLSPYIPPQESAITNIKSVRQKMYSVDLNSPETDGTGDDIAFICLAAGYHPIQVVERVNNLKYSCGGDFQTVSQSMLKAFDFKAALEEVKQ